MKILMVVYCYNENVWNSCDLFLKCGSYDGYYLV